MSVPRKISGIHKIPVKLELPGNCDNGLMNIPTFPACDYMGLENGQDGAAECQLREKQAEIFNEKSTEK